MLTAFFGTGNLCPLLFSIISKRMFMQILGLLPYFIMNVEVFNVFFIFQKSLTFSRKVLYFWILEKNESWV